MKTNFDNNIEFSLKNLENRRVVGFKLKDGMFVITEACDRYFDAVLTKEEFAAFISDLQELYERSE